MSVAGLGAALVVLLVAAVCAAAVGKADQHHQRRDLVQHRAHRDARSGVVYRDREREEFRHESAFSDYWYWRPHGASILYRNRMPPEIVTIFEKHGFIWGGKWYHFDTMHFEFRPELLVAQ